MPDSMVRKPRSTQPDRCKQQTSKTLPVFPLILTKALFLSFPFSCFFLSTRGDENATVSVPIGYHEGATVRADNKHGQSGQVCKDGIDGRSQNSSRPVAHEFIEWGKGSVWTPATQIMKPERSNQLPSSDERKEGGIIGSNWNNIYSGEDEPRSTGFFSTSEKIR